MNIAIVGATGNVGRKILEVLEKKKLSIGELFLVASSRSAGQKVNFNNKEYEVFKNSDYLSNTCLSLPIHPFLSEKDALKVCNVIHNIS